jgi:hypothetical protein
VDPEPVRERRVHLEHLLRLLHLLLLAEVLDRPHVVHPVGELDQDHPHVLGHRHDHLAVVLGLGMLAARELDAGQLGDALDEMRDLVAELGAQVVDRDAGVLGGVVQERRSDGRLVEVQLGDDLGGADRVVDEILAGAALLPLVRLLGEEEGAAQQIAIDVRLVGLDVREQLFEQVLVR